MTDTARLCEWCGDELIGKRIDATHCGSSCRAAATRHRQGTATAGDYALRGDQAPPIAEIREQLEEAKGRWSLIVREGIVDVFRERGEFHADDLAPLGIPDEHRNIIGAQIAGLVGAGRIVEIGRRKSVVPSRHGAKSGVYKLTELGREKLAGLDGGAPKPQGPDVIYPTGRATVEPGETSPAQLFDTPGATRPRGRSAFTDAEAA